MDKTLTNYWDILYLKKFLFFHFKSQLPGFYDSAVGEEKSLQISYNYRQQLHEIIIQDDEPLRIPKNCR